MDHTDVETEKTSSRVIQSKVTVTEIFKYTPPVSVIFSQCVVRYPGDYDTSFFKPSECASAFNVSKYYVQEMICYKIKLISNGRYHYGTTSSALAYPGMAFEFGFDMKTFGEGPLVLPVVHQSERWPSSSMYFAPQIRRFSPVTNSTNRKDNYFFLTYQCIDNKRLPYPYKTNCDTYELIGGSQDWCYKACLVKKTLENFNRFPFTEFIKESDSIDMNKKLINNFDWNDQNFTKSLKSYEAECNRKCNQLDCEERFYLTKKEWSGSFETSIAFRVNLPSNPNYSIIYQPMMLFYEYATYVLSCLGIWWGVSIYSVNPYRRRAHHRNPHQRKRNCVNCNSNQRIEQKGNFIRTNNAVNIDRLTSDMNAIRHKLKLVERELNSFKMWHKLTFKV